MNPDDECPLSKLKLDDKTHWRSAVHPVVVWLVSTKTSRPQALTEFQFFLLQEGKKTLAQEFLSCKDILNR